MEAWTTFKLDIRNCIVNCMEIINNDNQDLIITRLESVISAINLWVETYGGHDSFVLFLEKIGEVIVILDDSLTETQSRGPGRPKVNIPFRNIEELLSMNFRVSKIAKMYGVSRKTIHRLLASQGTSAMDSYTNITDIQLMEITAQILLQHPNTGYKRMKGYLVLNNIKVTDRRVRETMRAVDPCGVYQRTLANRAIVRRTYYVKYSNGMWHVDTNMKLIRWKIVIRGGVDGKSRTSLYLEAGGDNTAVANLHSFMKGIRQYGVPSRCRSDKGGENVLVARYMLETRGLDRSSHICGRSVHNQRIERFWRDVFYGCNAFYYNVFYRLEEDGILDVDNVKHICVLHYVFLPRMNRHLEIFREGWNRHPLSTESNMTPQQLMLLHLPPQDHDIIPSEEDLLGTDFVCNNADDLLNFESNGNDTIINPQIYENVLDRVESILLSTVNPLRISNTYGYDIFQDAIACINP